MWTVVWTLASLGFHWCVSIPAFTPDGLWGTPDRSTGHISFVSSHILCFLYSNFKFMRAGTFLSCLYNKRGGAGEQILLSLPGLKFHPTSTCKILFVPAQSRKGKGKKKTRKSSLALLHIFNFKCNEWDVSLILRLIAVQGTAEIEDLHSSVEMHNHLVLCGRAGRCKLHLFASGCVTH